MLLTEPLGSLNDNGVAKFAEKWRLFKSKPAEYSLLNCRQFLARVIGVVRSQTQQHYINLYEMIRLVYFAERAREIGLRKLKGKSF